MNKMLQIKALSQSMFSRWEEHNLFCLSITRTIGNSISLYILNTGDSNFLQEFYNALWCSISRRVKKTWLIGFTCLSGSMCWTSPSDVVSAVWLGDLASSDWILGRNHSAITLQRNIKLTIVYVPLVAALAILRITPVKSSDGAYCGVWHQNGNGYFCCCGLQCGASKGSDVFVLFLIWLEELGG